MEINTLTISSLSEETIEQLFYLWQEQFLNQQKVISCLPSSFISNITYFTTFLSNFEISPYCTIAKMGERIVGYMFFSDFTFHKETTAICPIMCHASQKEHKEVIYHHLYQFLAQKLVNDGILSHIVTYFATDTLLYNLLYELGFGMIVIDAFRDTTPLQDSNTYRSLEIRSAEESDIEKIMEVDKINSAYYSTSPIFLGDRNE